MWWCFYQFVCQKGRWSTVFLCVRGQQLNYYCTWSTLNTAPTCILRNRDAYRFMQYHNDNLMAYFPLWDISLSFYFGASYCWDSTFCSAVSWLVMQCYESVPVIFFINLLKQRLCNFWNNSHKNLKFNPWVFQIPLHVSETLRGFLASLCIWAYRLHNQYSHQQINSQHECKRGHSSGLVLYCKPLPWMFHTIWRHYCLLFIKTSQYCSAFCKESESEHSWLPKTLLNYRLVN